MTRAMPGHPTAASARNASISRSRRHRCSATSRSAPSGPIARSTFATNGRRSGSLVRCTRTMCASSPTASVCSLTQPGMSGSSCRAARRARTAATRRVVGWITSAESRGCESSLIICLPPPVTACTARMATESSSGVVERGCWDTDRVPDARRRRRMDEGHDEDGAASESRPPWAVSSRLGRQPFRRLEMGGAVASNGDASPYGA